ncbi:MAG: hypothetical protein ACXWV0_00205 [Flavisolibacter sp.]
MITLTNTDFTSDFRQYAVWLIAMVVVAFGFRFAKDIIAVVLNKLYEIFIQRGLAT